MTSWPAADIRPDWRKAAGISTSTLVRRPVGSIAHPAGPDGEQPDAEAVARRVRAPPEAKPGNHADEGRGPKAESNTTVKAVKTPAI